MNCVNSQKFRTLSSNSPSSIVCRSNCHLYISYYMYKYYIFSLIFLITVCVSKQKWFSLLFRLDSFALIFLFINFCLLLLLLENYTVIYEQWSSKENLLHALLALYNCVAKCTNIISCLQLNIKAEIKGNNFFNII